MPGFLQRQAGTLYLGYRALIAHPLKKLFQRGDATPKERFLRNYAPEGNIPTSTEDRRVLRGASRCIHCGLCEAYDAALAQLPRTLYGGASLLPVALARATPDLPRARALLQKLNPESLARGEAVCPTRVPLREIAAYLSRRLQALDEAAKAATSPGDPHR
jgi:succinate dehydrogenase/fumarate reductase-like Fe-S protein